MRKFERKIIHYIDEQDLIHVNDTVLVGVSGGADSMALLHVMLKLKAVYGLEIIVAHFNHMFRGEESDGDERFVKEFCWKNSIKFISKSQNMPEIIRETKSNTQLASRKYRYEFYQEVIECYSVDKLLLAHHLDDLAENVLMNLVRGVASSRKIGIPTKRQFGNALLVRPFMGVGKEEILHYVEQENVEYREDSSNKSQKYTRNRIRGNVVPLLKEENCQSLQNIAKFYEQISDDDAYIWRQASAIFDELEIISDGRAYFVEINAIFKVDKTLQRRLLQLILEYIFEKKKFNFSNRHIDLLMGLMNASQSSSVLQIDESFFAEKSFDKILFYFEKKESNYFEIDLVLPGETILPNGDRIVAGLLEDNTEETFDEFVVSESLGDLIVRSRMDGDRVEKCGLGHKKLKKIFLEMKIPVHERDEWPIVSKKSEKSEIICIPGIFKKKLEVENGKIFKLKFYRKNEEV